jgi:uncharacterized protein (TIRG00374 family)
VSTADDPEPSSSRSLFARLQKRAVRSALSWAGLLVSALFAFLAVRNVQFAEVWDGLRTSNYWWLLPAFVLLGVAILAKALRWHYLFTPETRPGTRAVLASLLIGYFFNSILPARAGEAARVLALKQRAGTSRAEAASTIVVERAYDVLVLLVLLFVAYPWLPRVSWVHGAVIFALALAAGLGTAIVVFAVFGIRPVHFVLRPLARLPFVSRERLEHVGDGLGQGLAGLRRPRLMLGALLWTTLGWLALAASTWFVIRGFHLGLPFAAALLVVVATNLAQILPSSPSGIGVYEAAALVAFRAYGVPDSRGLSCALVMHALSFLPFIAAGLFLLRGTLKAGGEDQDKAAPVAAGGPLRRSG